MAMKITKLGRPQVHIGPSRFTPDADTAMRLRKALPYVPEHSKSFARDLIEKHESFGGWTEKQAPYALQLLQRAREEYRRIHPKVTHPEVSENKRTQRTEPRVSEEGMRGLNRLFDAAKDVKKKPFILLAAEDHRLKLVPSSRGPGYAVFNRDDQGSRGFLGTVKPDGRVDLRTLKSWPVADALSRLGEDPATVAKAYGDSEAHCCFCARELTDERSVTAGYGPVCAGYYNLPWGA